MGPLVAATLILLSGTGIMAPGTDRTDPLPTPGCVFSGGAMICGGAQPTPPPIVRPPAPDPGATGSAPPDPVPSISTPEPSTSPAAPAPTPDPRVSEPPPDVAPPQEDDGAGGPLVAMVLGAVAVVAVGLTAIANRRRRRQNPRGGGTPQ